MPAGSAERVVRDLFEKADVGFDGKRPSDFKVLDERFYGRLVGDASLGLGESFMDGWWETGALDELVCKIMLARLDERVKGDWKHQLRAVKAVLFNLQTRARAPEVAEVHYNLGNDLYEAMLDPRMLYTCAYWKRAKDLAEAQEHKLDLVCRKAGIERGMKVLDLGCGWGGFAAWAAEKHGAEVTGISISREQVAWAKTKWTGLPVTYHLGDYREAPSLTGRRFDVVVSMGMAEHVGYKNHRALMETVDRCLKDDGVAVLHTIGNNVSKRSSFPFVDKYIFPNVCAPSIAQLGKAIEGLFVLEDLHNFGPDYDPTLMAWWRNFDSAWPRLKGPKYDERFRRMWQFYLLGAAGSSRAREGQLWHLVLTKTGRRQPVCRFD